MNKSIIEVLERIADKSTAKIAIEEKERSISYGIFREQMKRFASYLVGKGMRKKGVAIYLDKNIECMVSMFGTLQSGNFYCILDTKSPLDRIQLILNEMKPEIIICDDKSKKKLMQLDLNMIEIVQYEKVCNNEIDEDMLKNAYSRLIDTDIAYVLFTSGSTGVPKGTAVSHRALLSYVESVVKAFDLREDVIFGSQTPLYFSMSILDVFVSLYLGGTYVIIPHMLFSFPVKLIEYLNVKKVNIIYWVPTALMIVANRDTFKAIKPLYLEKVLFAGEVMPVKQLNYWIKELENCMFANLYGPTEITDTGTYYVVDRKFEDNESLPIGVAFDNCEILLITGENKLAVQGEEGEICVRGSFLAHGYYNNLQKTQEVFCQNPLNTFYPEIIYRTGDIGKYNECDELIYIGRKDFQIKRNGYRIEPGEIENAINIFEDIENSVCVYEAEKGEILVFYIGKIKEDELRKKMAKHVPTYMMPDSILKLKRFPINSNGKIDRKKLLQYYKEERAEKND